MKTYTLTITVDEDQLEEAYRDGAALEPYEPSPSTIEMLESEAGWLLQSGVVVTSIEEIQGDIE